MEMDLAVAGAPTETVRSQVCVVGAGIAGLTLAHALMKRGISVVLLEAGGRGLEERSQSLFEGAELKGQEHAGSRVGRFRVFGGSSLRWGGQLLAAARGQDAAWPFVLGEWGRFQADAERLLGVDALPYEAQEFFSAIGGDMPTIVKEMPGVEARVSKWIPFSKRNLAASVGREVTASELVRVFLHAQVTELLLDEAGARVKAVLVRDPGGRVARFEAEQVVMAAGTVETVRLLLASQSVRKDGVGNDYGRVGNNFHDHLTLPVATVTGAARARLLKELRPWVVDGTVHSFKLEASAELCERLGMNPVLAHVTIEEPEGSGVAVVREMLTARQRGEMGGYFAEHMGRLPGALVESIRLLWQAKVRGRRFVSSKAEVRLQLNAAQDMPSTSSVRLSESVDAFGMRQAAVDWHVTENERATLRRYSRYLRDRFEAMGLEGVGWSKEIGVESGPLTIEDARHAMGGACMGDDPQTSVVDGELRVHGVENLFVASAAVFPNGSVQLPTLTLVALTLRLAERLGSLKSEG